MAASKLTQNMENFALALASGMSQRAAYRCAYPKNHSTDTTIDTEACRLASDQRVRLRLAELRETQAERVIWSTVEAADAYKRLAEEAIEQRRLPQDQRTMQSPDGELRFALDALNRLAGNWPSDGGTNLGGVKIIDDIS